MVLSGLCGAGKTTLAKQLANNLSHHSRILFPEGDIGTFEEIVDSIFSTLDLDTSCDSTGEKLNEIYVFLRKTERSPDKILLIVDNCEKLPVIAIKQISYLTEASKSGNLQILFVGSTQIKALFNNPVLVSLRLASRRIDANLNDTTPIHGNAPRNVYVTLRL